MAGCLPHTNYQNNHPAEERNEIELRYSTPTPWSGLFQDHGLRPWSLNLPLSAANPMHEGASVSGAPFLDLVAQTLHPRGRGRALFAEQ